MKEVCAYHDELYRRTFPRARGLTYPMEGKNATAVRRALRWGFNADEINVSSMGRSRTDFHRTKQTYLYLESILRG